MEGRYEGVNRKHSLELQAVSLMRFLERSRSPPAIWIAHVHACGMHGQGLASGWLGGSRELVSGRWIRSGMSMLGR